jgi:hypothetical protein
MGSKSFRGVGAYIGVRETLSLAIIGTFMVALFMPRVYISPLVLTHVMPGRRSSLTESDVHSSAAANMTDAITNLGDALPSTKRLVSSYSTLIAGERTIEGALFLWSIALVHPGARVYIASNKKTYAWYRDTLPGLFQHLDLRWTFAVDKYDVSMSREEMIDANVWSDFQMEKAYVMEAALVENLDTVYVDADMLLTSPVVVPTAQDIQLGVSPHYMKPEAGTKWGVYNGGMLWTNQYSVGQAWVKATKKSRYFDQAAIEDLVNEYVTFEFGEEANLGWWRPMHGVGGMPEFIKHVYLNKEGLLAYKNRTVSSIHAHFISKHCCSRTFVNLITRIIVQSPRYRNLVKVLWWAKRDFFQPAPTFDDWSR